MDGLQNRQEQIYQMMLLLEKQSFCSISGKIWGCWTDKDLGMMSFDQRGHFLDLTKLLKRAIDFIGCPSSKV